MHAIERHNGTAIVLDDRDYDHWRNYICDQLLLVDTPKQKESRFGMQLDLRPMHGPVLMHARSHHRGVELILTRERIARGPHQDAVGLSFVLEGTAMVERDGRQYEMREGDLMLLDSREPFRKALSNDYCEQFVYLPRTFVETTVGDAFSATGPRFAPRDGLGRVLGDTMASFARARSSMTVAECVPVLSALAHVAAAVFAPQFLEQARPSMRALARARIERFIAAHLADPALSPMTIAAALGCSTRYLHLVFEEGGVTVGATILALRLERCRERLADPRNREISISEIAFGAGFNDAAHFSRAFKARFGITPREARG